MFELITGQAKHIPSKPALPVAISIGAQLALVGALVLPLLLFTGQLPMTPTMLAFVAAAPAPPPPPPPPPPAAKKAVSPDIKPVPTTGAVPIAAPPGIRPELPDDEGFDGVPGGVEGGIPGGVVGGVVGGLPTEIPPPPPAPALPAVRAPVRIGGQIEAPALVQRVEPIYAPLAVRANVTGTVILEAVVDAEGRVAEVKVLRSAHKLLDESAIAAVRQWRYSPLVLNGIRESFVVTVVLSFQLTNPT
jgi:periplasmic protein TonB